MIYKSWIIIIIIIVAQLINGCTPDIKDSKHDISDKYKFIICELNSINMNINQYDKIIPQKGSFGYQSFSKKEIPEVILYNGVYIDPFLPGENKVTVKNWKWPGEDWIQKEMTMSGASLNYIQDPNGHIIICFAGPDKDIDTKNNVNIIKNINHTYVLSEIEYSSEVIEYDPTNGIYSNGDIIFISTQGKFTGSSVWSMITNDPVCRKFSSTRRTWEDGSWVFSNQ